MPAESNAGPRSSGFPFDSAIFIIVYRYNEKMGAVAMRRRPYRIRWRRVFRAILPHRVVVGRRYPPTKVLAFLQNLSVGHDGNWERYPRAPP